MRMSAPARTALKEAVNLLSRSRIKKRNCSARSRKACHVMRRARTRAGGRRAGRVAAVGWPGRRVGSDACGPALMQRSVRMVRRVGEQGAGVLVGPAWARACTAACRTSSCWSLGVPTPRDPRTRAPADRVRRRPRSVGPTRTRASCAGINSLGAARTGLAERSPAGCASLAARCPELHRHLWRRDRDAPVERSAAQRDRRHLRGVGAADARSVDRRANATPGRWRRWPAAPCAPRPPSWKRR
jgi:hypothetical protein